MKHLNSGKYVWLFCGLGVVSGCESTGLAGDGGTPTSDTGSTPNVDSGLGEWQPQLTYMPEGCGYQVSTPDVFDARRSMDVFGATPATRGIHASFVGPTDTSFAVNWQSDRDTLASSVLIGTTQAEVAAADGAAGSVRRVDGHYMLFSSSPSAGTAARAHEVHVCGLTAGTVYYYKVGGPGHWSEVHEISTGPAIGSTTPFSFGATGDSRGNEEDAWTISQRRLTERSVDFELFSGDAVVLGTIQSQWDDFFGARVTDFAVESFLASHQFMIANGNHDSLSKNYLAQFALPQQQSAGEVGQGEEWYSFDYGNAHFVFLNDTVLDSGVLGGAESDWLRADLQAVDRARTPWIFVVHHRPLYTCQSTHAPDTSLRSNWQPIFDEFHVDFVIAGHNHVYERSLPIRGLEGGQGMVAPAGANGVPQIAAGLPSGTVYMVSAGVGAPLYPVNSDCPTSFRGVSERNYTVFEISGRSIHVRVRNSVTDDIIDEFEYIKS